MNDVKLTSGLQNNLLSMQRSNSLTSKQSAAQSTTGKEVGKSMDDFSNYFAKGPSDLKVNTDKLSISKGAYEKYQQSTRLVDNDANQASAELLQAQIRTQTQLAQTAAQIGPSASILKLFS
ncbi:MAG TPA: hypothetical protein VN426_05960 [Syntrophomonadaceae bacterium]|nr:hypothetical protein [Syntrophomonadaceae bacterium]